MELTEVREKLLQIQLDEERRKDVFTVAFCGVFSSGKSSILNRLLDCRWCFSLPVGDFPITKVVTRIEYGEKPEFYCLTGNGSGAAPITKEHFESMVVGKMPLPAGCTEILIKVPSQILEKNVVFIDTPGFLDEMGGELEQMSRDAVLKSDMAVLCTSAASLGHQFEREYLEELNESIGNYCMIVNRMDCCNTKEDWQNVEKKAEFLMKGKGGTVTNEISFHCFRRKSYFLTTAVGVLWSLDGFDGYLEHLLKDEKLRDFIKWESSEKIRRYRTAQIKNEIEIEIMGIEEKLEILYAQHSEKLKDIKQENFLRKDENTRKQYAFREKYNAKLQDGATEFGNRISKLMIVDFSPKAHLELESVYMKILQEMGEEIHLVSHSDLKKLKDVISKFTVPRAVHTKKRKLSWWERMLDGVEDIVTFGEIIGDGWEYEVNDYKAAASQKVKQELIPQLEKEIKRIADSIVFIEPLAEESGLEEEINLKKQEMENWEKETGVFLPK